MKNGTATTSALHDCLQDLIRALNTLDAMLDTELNSLKQKNLQQISELARQKQAQLDLVQQQLAKLDSELASLGFAPYPQGVRMLAEELNDSSLQQHQSALDGLSKICREKNLRIGSLVHRSRSQGNKALALLRSSANDPLNRTYTGTGKMPGAQTSRLLGKA